MITDLHNKHKNVATPLCFVRLILILVVEFSVFSNAVRWMIGV